MLKLRKIKSISKTVPYRQLLCTSSFKSSKKNAYVFATVAASGVLSCGAWLRWSSCQHSNTLDGGAHYGWGRWIQDKYKEKVVNSSTLRFGRAAYAVVYVFVDYKYTLSNINTGSDEYNQQMALCHQRSADRFRDLCSKNGGVFMKVGQHIGSMDFLFPREYTDTLKCFQYRGPVSSIDDVRYVIETDTQHSLGELFSSFDEEPIGSASLAQVHAATLKSGEKVAVKVQHKTVKLHAFQDAIVIEFFAGVATKIFPEFQFQWLIDQIKQNLPLELDFINEGHNCEKMGDYLKNFNDISVPKIFWKDSTQRVLFMEYINGGAVDDLEYIQRNKLNVNEISNKLGHLYSEMIFMRGDIHCDPHAGNILVRKGKMGKGVEVILLDHGLYAKMNDRVRLDYCELWQNMINFDLDGIRKSCVALGVGQYYSLFACMVSGRSWNSIQNGIAKKALTSNEMQELQFKAVNFVDVITKVLEKMPRELVMVFKTNDLLRGLDSRLQTHAASSSFITMSKCCMRAVYEERYPKCKSVFSRWHLYGNLKCGEFRVMLYQLSLFLPKSFVPNVTLVDVAAMVVGQIINIFKYINDLPKYLKGST